jgi:hypothetical protein
MDDAMKIRDLNFKVTCLQNGLRIEKGQANVAYKENQLLKIEVDLLKTKLQNANEDKLATISAERNRWAREDFKALAIRDLENKIEGLGTAQEFACSDKRHQQYGGKLSTMQLTNIYYLKISDELAALKDQG